MSDHILPEIASTSDEDKNSDVLDLGEHMSSIEVNDYNCGYLKDIWNVLLQQDLEKQSVLLRSPQLKYRGVLVNKLRIWVKRLGVSVATLHIAVSHLDRVMDNHIINTDCFSEVALTCLSIAAKCEERIDRAPRIAMLSSASGVILQGPSFKEMEFTIGNCLSWKLQPPTAVTFVDLLAYYVVHDIVGALTPVTKKLKTEGANLLESYLDLSLSNVRLAALDSVDVGCACIACARSDIGLSPWPPSMVRLTTRGLGEITTVMMLLHKMKANLNAPSAPAEIEDVETVRRSPGAPNAVSTVMSPISSSTQSHATGRQLPIYAHSASVQNGDVEEQPPSTVGRKRRSISGTETQAKRRRLDSTVR